jgi:hypothetical protein
MLLIHGGTQEEIDKMTRFDRNMFVAGLGVLGSFVGSANATWSILIADTRTGEIVIGSATCVELIDLQLSTPVLISGVGAVTAQSAVDNTGSNRQLIRDRLLQGVPLDAILDELSVSDAGHGNRQYGMIDTFGDTLTYSGFQNAAWAGGQTGRIDRGVPGTADDIVYAVQGNILSGANVVQAAVDALNASNGDLPQMMMEAMQAAKVAGGDGRCSCSNADPTGCGSPPPAPFKSADVGYMLGTRAGDIDAIRGIYPYDGAIGAQATMDLDGDGFEDVIVGNRDTDEISIYMNTSAEGSPLSSLLLRETFSAPASGTVAMGAGDFDGDGQQELAVAVANPPQLLIYEMDDQGGLAVPPISLDAPGQIAGIDVGPMLNDRDAIAVSVIDAQRVIFYGSSNDAYAQLGSVLLDHTPGGIRLADVVGDNAMDLIVTDPNNDAAHLFEQTGSLAFADPISIATLAAPIGAGSADMDNDGDNEILVQTGAGRQVQVFVEDGGNWSLWGQANASGIGIGFDVGDMNGDGFPDVVTTVQATNRNMRLYISDGQGGFSLQTRTRVGSAARSVELVDMNNNGDLDIVVGSAGTNGLSVLDNPRGGDLPQPGRFAAGEYFMALNVPNQRRSDPDPVDQLQDLYDQWLATRDGKIDAVRSSISGRSVLGTGESSTLRVELRDMNGTLMDISDPALIEVVASGGSISLGTISINEPGVFDVQIGAGEETGRESIMVHAGEAGEQITLMPSFDVAISMNPADFNADGVCNFYDVTSFVASFLIEDPDADFTGDQAWDFHDVSAFLSDYNNCVGG